MISGNAWPYRVLEEGVDISEYFNVAWAPTDWNPVPPGTFEAHIPAWKHVSRRGVDRLQTDASTVRDLTINAGRERDLDRVIAHFVEPYYPYAAAARERGESTKAHENPFDYLLHSGEKSAVWGAYLAELRYGLDNVYTLLDNFDAENVVITADHGDVFGEWWWMGLRAYEHYPGTSYPKVRKVSFVRTTATDKQTHNPEPITKDTDVTVEDDFSHLGYLDS